MGVPPKGTYRQMQVYGEHFKVTASYHPKHEEIFSISGSQLEVSDRKLLGN